MFPLLRAGLVCFSVLSLWVFSFGLSSLAAYQLKSQRFVPENYYVGQRVRMFLELNVPPDEAQVFGMQMGGAEKWQLDINISDNLPNNIYYRLYEVRIISSSTPNTYTMELHYAVFTTDVTQLEAFEVRGLTIEALTVPRALSSLLGSESGAQELPELESRPLSLPWVDLSIALLVQIIVLLPIAVFQSSRRLRKFLQIVYQNIVQRKPYRQFLRQLHLLQQSQNINTLEYYRILSSQVRHYLGRRIMRPCSAYTTEELAELQPLLEARELWQEVLAVLRAGDDFRFRTVAQKRQSVGPPAKENPKNNKCRKLEVTTIVNFAKLLEKQFRQGELHRV